MDSALSWRFAARRSAPSMVVPLISAATLSAGRHGSALRVSLSAPLVCVASFGKGTTIACRTRLARNTDKLTESVNLTWTVYQGLLTFEIGSHMKQQAKATICIHVIARWRSSGLLSSQSLSALVRYRSFPNVIDFMFARAIASGFQRIGFSRLQALAPRSDWPDAD